MHRRSFFLFISPGYNIIGHRRQAVRPAGLGDGIPCNTITLGDKTTHLLGRISGPVSSKTCLKGAHTTKMVALGSLRREGYIDASLGVYALPHYR